MILINLTKEFKYNIIEQKLNLKYDWYCKFK